MFKVLLEEKDDLIPQVMADGSIPKCLYPCEADNFERLGFIPHLVLVSLRQDNAADVEQAARELGEHIAGDNDKECHELYLMGGHGLVLSAMMRWPQNETIQAQCFHTLSRMASHLSECQDALLALGFMDIVAAGMNRFPNSFDIQLYGVSAIHHLFLLKGSGDKISCSLREGANAERKHFVDDLEGIDLIVKAMLSFPNNAVMQHDGCRALRRLSPVKEFQCALSRSDAVVVVASALKQFHDNKGVSDAASDFMKNLFESFEME